MAIEVYKSLDELGISRSDIDKAISLSENWLLNSGIQNMHNRPRLYGSFNSWATMFALQALCMLKQITNKKEKFDINYFV